LDTVQELCFAKKKKDAEKNEEQIYAKRALLLSFAGNNSLAKRYADIQNEKTDEIYRLSHLIEQTEAKLEKSLLDLGIEKRDALEGSIDYAKAVDYVRDIMSINDF
jgi:hypothetical protein